MTTISKTKLNTESNPIDYVARTNLAIDYIVNNLSGDLKLEEIANVAMFSPFHFHRVFRSLLGETLNQFVKRLRLERALYLMSHSPKLTLTEIALDCGFSSSSDFSRNFKTRFGKPPSSINLQELRSSNREAFASSQAAAGNKHNLSRLPENKNPDNFSVTLRQLPARNVAYLRVLDPYQPNAVPEASKRLVSWAEKRGLASGAWLGYMWEDPEITDTKDCRYDLAVVLDSEKRLYLPDGEVGWHEFPAMQVAEVEIKGDIELEMRAIDWLFRTWLPRSGFVPDEQPAFEAWHGKPFEQGLEYFELSCQLPVKRS